MSGVDKVFDYIVPPGMSGVRVGSPVRVVLNNRRVDGWVTAVGEPGSPGFDAVPPERLAPVLSVAALGVDPVVTQMSEWVAARWCGPRRNVLASATPSRKGARASHPSRGSAVDPADEVSSAALVALDAGGAVLMVPPLASALSAVVAAAGRGTVLVVCPTLRMARLGAAHLRRRGLTTAELPDDIDAALAGRDVVIGARSAVLSPCAGLGAIVVVDEHEETLHEERVPTWWAAEVALERGRRLGVPVLLTSAVPSARAEMLAGRAVPTAPGGWPDVRLVDLNEVPVRGSLLSAETLEAVRSSSGRSLLVLNTKGTARLMACKRCRSLIVCGTCGSTVSVDSDTARCGTCGTHAGGACPACGSTGTVNVRPGTARIADDLSRATGANVREVTTDSDDIGGSADAWVGTDALLHRVRDAGTVVFLDIDRDLSAPRSSAPREVLAAVARAARIVGRRGRLVIQTRQPSHPLLLAIASGDLRTWLDDDVALRRRLTLPPFCELAVLGFGEVPDPAALPDMEGIDRTVEGKDVLVRAADAEGLAAYVASVRASTSGRVRVAVNPPRV
ncbi:MAG: hypothetical protein ACO36A_06815 [Ilumatobacteraceae bacterium]